MVKLNRRTRIVALSLAAASTIYLIVGFVVVPWIARQALVEYVTRDLGHRLTVGAVRFNPLKFTASIDDLHLQDPEGGQLLRFKRLDVELALSSAVERVWKVPAISLLEPSIHVEVQRDGRLNFSRLLEAMRSPEPTDGPLPSLRIGRVGVIDGRAVFEDPASGKHARLVLSPVALDLRDLSTLDSEQGRYTLSAISAAGETLRWSGQGGLNPLQASGKIVLSGWNAATLVAFLGRHVRLEAPSGQMDLSANYRLAYDRGGRLAGRIDGIKFSVDDLALIVPGARQPLLALASARVNAGALDVGRTRLAIGDVQLNRLRVNLHDDGGPDGWRTALVSPMPVNPPLESEKVAIGGAAGVSAGVWSIHLPSVAIANSALAMSEGAGMTASEGSVERLGLRFAAHAQRASEVTEIALRDVALTMQGLALRRAADRMRLGHVTLGVARASTTTGKAAEAHGVELKFNATEGIVAGATGTVESAVAAAASLRLILADAVTPQASPQIEAATLRLDLALARLRRDDDSLSVTKLSLAAGSVTTGASTAPLRASASGAADLKKVDVAASGLSATMAGIKTVVETFKGTADDVMLAPASGADRPYADAAAVGGLRMVVNQVGVNSGRDSIRLGSAVLAASRIQANYGATGMRKPGAAPLPFQGAMTDLSVELADIEGARSGRAAAQVKLARAVAGVKTLALQRSADGSVPPGHEVAAQEIRVDVKAFNARQGNDALRLATAAVAVDRMRSPPTASGAIALTAVRVESTGASARRGTAKGDTIEFARGALSTASAAIELDHGLRDLRADGAAGQLQKVVLRHPASGAELARLGLAEAEGASVRLAQRTVSVARIALGEVAGQAVIGPGGRLDWNALVAAFAPPPAAPARGETTAPPPWKVTVKSAQVTNLTAALTDQRRTPALTIGLDSVSLRASDIDTHGAAPAQMELTASVRSGGKIKAVGQFSPGSLAADLNVTLTDIDLRPAQSMLNEYANLEIMSASASAAGRLRYSLADGAGADLVYEGSLALSKVQIEETSPRAPLLSADALTAPEATLRLGPDRLDIPDLRVSGLVTRLVIAEDQTVNLGAVLKPRPAAKAQEGDGGMPFPLSIGRIRVEHGRLDFADRSLRPQFAVRVHEIGGTITGVSSTSTASSRLELEGRVDEFGYARIRGDLKLLALQEYAKLEMTFRNLEMTALTPYAAKFAGYRIASGKLSLDLDYTLENRRLVGKNRILLDKLELGEKVDSPSALDLPLELAIALLKDDRGRIDIGLPVQGSLEDPKFNIGDLIGKAIGNLIGNIVTAPFKLLASLFGSGTEQLDNIAFDPGSSRLLPPEREKLRTVAAALSKRPQLALKIKPGIAAAEDAAAMQVLALRREVAAAAGLKLQADEDPGPMDYSNPRIQMAIDSIYAKKLGSTALQDRRGAFAQLAEGESADPAMRRAPDRLLMMYRNLFEHLMNEGSVPESALMELGRRRGEAVAAELTGASGVAAVRVSTQPPAPATDKAAGVVATELELVTAK